MNSWSTELVVAVVCGLLALASLTLAGVAARTSARTRRELEEARAESRALTARVAALEHEARREVPPAHRVVPVLEGRVHEGRVHEGELPTVTIDGRIDGRLFADLVARESVVKAAGLAHGLRRALDPATRNRIRFEARQEVKRARRQRKADLRAALRDHREAEREAMAAEDSEDAA
jgi:hypothetical protein